MSRSDRKKSAKREAAAAKPDWLSLSIDDGTLPDWITDNALSSGGYPYDRRMKERRYLEEIHPLHIELQKVQCWTARTGERIVVLFEGRDSAGKGGTIKRYMLHLNPRVVKVHALPKPNERERGQWYFQRYAEQLPTTGEIALFDRSWYNRAGVEPVMGFCTPEQTAEFLEEVPKFESMLIRSGTRLIKFWLTVGREEQIRRLHARRHDPLKQWKLSQIDIDGLAKWEDYTRARRTMFEETDTTVAPWTVIKSNDKKRARLNCIRHFLDTLPYDGKDEAAIGEIDRKIVSTAFADYD